jgi:hypothetical protein
MDLAITHGWSSLALAYGVVQGPMLVGLAREQARLQHYLRSPAVALPLTAIACVSMTVASPVLSALGFAQHGLGQLVLGTAMCAALGYRGGRVAATTDLSMRNHRRGAIVDGGSLRRASRPTPGVGDVTLAGNPVPAADEAKHFKLIGTTGTGKSTAIQEILGAALARGDRAVIADPDAGYLRRFYEAKRGDVILNPFDERSVTWDLFSEIKSGYDVEQLARSLIPDHEGADRSWRGYARTFFAAVTRQAHESGVTEVGELYRLLVIADGDELRTLLKGTPAQPFLDEHNTRMFDSIRSVTSSAVGALDHIARQRSRPFSIREWVGGGSQGVLFIPYRAGQIAALRSTISAWMRLAIFEAMEHDPLPDDGSSGARSGQRRLWFVVDELDALGQIDGLKDALARLRKFGGRCVLGFQSIAQVSSTYGQGDAHTIVENCGNTLILRCSASEGGGTARFASQLIGDREVLQASTSTTRRPGEFFGSRSESEQIRVEPAVLPAQIEQLPDLSGYLKFASDPAWHRVRLAALRQWGEFRADWVGGADRADGNDAPGSRRCVRPEDRAHE